MILETKPGKTHPIGATVYPEGVNFCVFSKHAEAIELLLFDGENTVKPAHIIPLDNKRNRTFHYWHIFVRDLQPGQVYAYRVYGPYAPELGHRFDAQKVLLDPYAKAIVGDEIYNREAAILPGDNCAKALRGVVVDTGTYDWEGDMPLRLPFSSSIIYELHVGGFTRNPNSELEGDKRGTFAGLIQKIPYLKNLGITAVELLPVHYFDPEDVRPGLENYWGYSTIGFFAPYRKYSSDRSPLGPLNEFRDMVKALHKAGIEVILDVVFNHTAEGNEKGATLSFRGFDNTTYYILDENKRYYSNYSGCGNTFNTNHPIVGSLIIDCLNYWVSEMHVDGFRFDLAAILSRNIDGTPIEKGYNIIWAIESDPILAGTKLIAEAWDAAGLYSVGQFVEFADWFAEWNGPFRDDVRRFVKSDPGCVITLAARILGSPDIYPDSNDVNRSVNFITCHDGFTLNDLVAYNEKHNEANGEENTDGANDNHSWNCGVEGDTENAKISALRLQQMKNLLTILFMSQGTPMLLMGDEVRRTQKGNNNAYCQDNGLSWFDWSQVDKQFDLWCFVRRLIHLHQSLALFHEEKGLEVTYASLNPHITWHGVRLGKPDWSQHSHSLAFSLRHPKEDEYLHVMLNAYWQPLEFELPLTGKGENWYRLVDTSLPLDDSVCDLWSATLIESQTYTVAARSSVVLMVKDEQ
ncbi:MAG: Glycogen operon protein GlgX [Chroococcopsis gigantea SAG 12.99]|jgi:isoamylase|nr:glycogen debranching protein GlgX [Chlorogloea purpurea SAG 13.99]MDV2999147.1 Glycogen operon protein GlgX [Chroococcopsis gigantea SAG 12.99]